MRTKAEIFIDADPRGLIYAAVMPPLFTKRVRETRFKQRWKMCRWHFKLLMLGWNGEEDPIQFYVRRQQMMHARRFGNPKKQRGTFSMFPAGTTAAAAPSGQVVITNKSYTDFGINETVSCDAQFQTDGEFWIQRLRNTDVQINGEWWSEEPETGIGSSYDVRTNGITGTYDIAAASNTVWVQMNLTRTWGVDAGPGFDVSTAVGTFEIRNTGSGGALDTANITTTASSEF